jgi:hypothetical protein
LINYEERMMAKSVGKGATVITGAAHGATVITAKKHGATSLNAGQFKAAKHNVHAKAHPGEGWDDKVTSTRNSRKGVGGKFK